VGNYLLTRLLEAVVTIWGVITIVFFSLRLTGDPVLLLVPVGTPPEQVEQLRHALGFDRPLLVQYFSFWGRLAHGDFGDSLRFGEPALPLVFERLPATAELALLSMAVAIVLGGLAGTVAALRRGSVFELVAMIGALFGQATPVFWSGIMLVLVFAAELQWLPSGGRGGVSHLVLPVTTLALFSSASIARLLRSSLLEVQSQDYVRTARAVGLSERGIFWRHELKNALIPVVTIVGVQTGRLLGGAVITETIFSWPGVGRLVVQAIENRDFPLVQATATVLAITIVGVNLLVDLTYSLLDPRIRLGRASR
jgi:peptide/nickel transport system permease protein